MFRSLRFRLPALFLAGIALAGVVTTAIAVRLFQDYTRSQALEQLKREANGLSQLYAEQAIRRATSASAPSFAAEEAREGDRRPHLLRRRADRSRARSPGSARCRATRSAASCSVTDGTLSRSRSSRRGRSGPTSPSRSRSQLGKRRLRRDRRREAEDGAARPLAAAVELLGVAFVGRHRWSPGCSPGTSRGGSRGRCSRSRARPTRWREGHYDVGCPRCRGGGEIEHLAERFGEMAAGSPRPRSSSATS